MQVARVVGTVVCSHKDEGLSGVTLLVIQPLAKDGAPFGRTLVATDAAGAGVGEDVFFVRGAEASFPFHPAHRPDRRLDCRHRGLGVYLNRTPSRRRRPVEAGLRPAETQHRCRSPRSSARSSPPRSTPPLDGAKLLLVQPETPEGEARGPVLLAIDSVGAGVGERVLVVIEGKAAGDALGRRGAPVDAAIIGIIDCVDDTMLVDVAPVEAA